MEELKLGIEINWSKCAGCATCVRTEGEETIRIENCVATVVNHDNVRRPEKLVKDCPAKAITITGLPEVEKGPRQGGIFGRYFRK